MKIETKILSPLLGMSALIALVGGLAVNRQQFTAAEAATREAEHVAEALSLGVISDAGELDASSQLIVERLHAAEGRDISVMDAQKRVVADAEPHSIGEPYVDDPQGEVAATIRDGKPRRFVETSADHPEGIKQIVAQVRSNSGKVLGAIVLEYGPLYEELMKAARSSVRELIVAVFGSTVVALLFAFYLGRSISQPLEQLTGVATGFAAGWTDLPLPAPRKDEIGKLAAAFKNMVEKRQHAEEELRRLHDELETRVAERTRELAQVNCELLAENAERERAEETSRESEEKFRQMSDTVNDVIWIASSDLKTILFVSTAYEEIWGYSMESLYANPHQWIEAILPEDQPGVFAAFGLLMENEPEVSVEYRITRADGTIRWIHNRGFQVRDAAGNLIRLTGIASDISERKRAEAELGQVHKELLETSRQAGMAEVATGVLHNVGNVLNSVNVSTTLIMETVKKSKTANVTKLAALLEEHAADLGTFVSTNPQGKQLPVFLRQLSDRLAREQQSVVKEVESLVKNIEHIKDIVAMQQSYGKKSGVTEVLDIAELVEDSLRLNASALLRHDVEVVRDFHAAPPINAEKHKILQILVNLIRNAKHACDEGGRTPKRMTLRVANGDGRIKIAVSDNGIGIPAENLTRIFNHGFTTRKEGHGFGLHSAALAAQQLGGALRVESPGFGHGATFTLELPAPASA